MNVKLEYIRDKERIPTRTVNPVTVKNCLRLTVTVPAGELVMWLVREGQETVMWTDVRAMSTDDCAYLWSCTGQKNIQDGAIKQWFKRIIEEDFWEDF